MKKTVTILGSTGSIGTNTVDVLKRYPNDYQVVGLTGNKNIALLAQQALQLQATVVATADEASYADLKKMLSGSKIEVLCSNEGVLEVARRQADWTMSAIVGSAGLMPTMEAIQRGKTVALANKETLVCAGSLVMAEVKACKSTLIPVDSEHSAIFQTLEEHQRHAIDRILLTASGGPFRDKDLEFMKSVTPEQAIAHPNWRMGAKISVDCATMMNKGLELIEAYHLFNVSPDRIEILIHPQSIMHSGVAYIDGSVLAHLGNADMRTPIAYALGYPKRLSAPTKRLDFTQMGSMNFFAPDEMRFPSLRLARQALKQGQSATCVLNAANEEVVGAFLKGQTGFLDIARITETVLEKSSLLPLKTIQDVIDLDVQARSLARQMI